MTDNLEDIRIIRAGSFIEGEMEWTPLGDLASESFSHEWFSSMRSRDTGWGARQLVAVRPIPEKPSWKDVEFYDCEDCLNAQDHIAHLIKDGLLIDPNADES